MRADDDSKDTQPEFNMHRIIMGCIDKFNVTEEQMKKAITTKDARAVTPCFWSCCYKKTGVLNSEGEYDLDSTLNLAKKMFVYDIYMKIEDIAKTCGSVNDDSVIDGDAGCERGVLLANCMIENGNKAFPELFYYE
ncbi:hypothetical protein HW555_003134 [Spodoptera exigua]|uniref:Uncharacterized protein n=1 Tax=Spodoptera exigua TaxID=7107 RepID=A0A835GKV6_SPOEX|nr:hypothetical protein HW555_003134 [Spodoptera exigua]